MIADLIWGTAAEVLTPWVCLGSSQKICCILRQTKYEPESELYYFPVGIDIPSFAQSLGPLAELIGFFLASG